jgi:AraC-like DNA-binding protein
MYSAYSQNSNSFHNIKYERNNINIDGKLDDWKNYSLYHFSDSKQKMKAPENHPFTIDYPKNYDKIIKPPKSINSTEIRVCWDINYLYFAFVVNDRHLFAEKVSKEKENPEIYLNDGIEIYIDTKNDSKNKMDINDYQFIIDILNQTIVFKGNREQFLEKSKFAVPKDYGQNILFQSAVQLKGNINDSLSKSIGYVIETKIPFSAIGINPIKEKKFKIDICNNDVDYFFAEATKIDGKIYITRPANLSGYNDCGFPDTWQYFQLSGTIPNWDIVSYHTKSFIIKLIVFLIFILLIVAVIFFIKWLKLSKLPRVSEIDKLIAILNKTQTDKDITANQKLLQKANEYIMLHPNSSCSSKLLAEHLGISLRKLQNITKSEINCTPTNYIYLIKLKQAAQYLMQEKGNISETAYEFGFSDPAYFSKLFKRHFGMTPIQFVEYNKK